MVSDTSAEFFGTTPAPPSGDRVELTDLEVIQRWSLAVRGASAERAEVVAALRADLAWLERGRSAPAPSTPRKTTTRSATTRSTTTRSAGTRSTTTRSTTAKKTAAKKSTARTSTSRGGTRRR
jgi:hypothetical protein